MQAVREKLTGGTRTSVGSADEVIQKLLKNSAGLPAIYDLFLDEDPVVAMRASYVAMKVAEEKPKNFLVKMYLREYTKRKIS